jgi:hypothetical protein
MEPDTSDPEKAPGEENQVVPWIVVGSGAALATAGGVMIGLAMRDISKVENADGTGKEIQAAQERVPVLSSIGFGLAAVGLAGAGVGVYLLTADSGPPGDNPDTASVRLQLGASSVSVNGRF